MSRSPTPRRSDEQRVAPGADTLRSLLGDAPALLLLDELSVYLRKVGRQDDAQGQLTAFLTSLFKAAYSGRSGTRIELTRFAGAGHTPTSPGGLHPAAP